MSTPRKLIIVTCLFPLGLIISGCAQPRLKATEIGYADLIDKIEFEKINIFPSSDRLAALRYNLAELYFSNGKYEEARKEAKNAITLSPNKWEYHLQLAKIYIALDRFDDAELEVKALPSDLLNPLSLVAMPFMLLSQPEKEAFVKDAKKWSKYPLELTLTFDTETLQTKPDGTEIKAVISFENSGNEKILMDTQQLKFHISDHDGKTPYNLVSISSDDYTASDEEGEQGRFIVLKPKSKKQLILHRSIAKWENKKATALAAGEYVAFVRYMNLGNLAASESASAEPISRRTPSIEPHQMHVKKVGKSDLLQKYPDAKPWVGILTSQLKVIKVADGHR